MGGLAIGTEHAGQQMRELACILGDGVERADQSLDGLDRLLELVEVRIAHLGDLLGAIVNRGILGTERREHVLHRLHVDTAVNDDARKPLCGKRVDERRNRLGTQRVRHACNRTHLGDVAAIDGDERGSGPQRAAHGIVELLGGCRKLRRRFSSAGLIALLELRDERLSLIHEDLGICLGILGAHGKGHT